MSVMKTLFAIPIRVVVGVLSFILICISLIVSFLTILALSASNWIFKRFGLFHKFDKYIQKNAISIFLKINYTICFPLFLIAYMRHERSRLSFYPYYAFCTKVLDEQFIEEQMYTLISDEMKRDLLLYSVRGLSRQNTASKYTDIYSFLEIIYSNIEVNRLFNMSYKSYDEEVSHNENLRTILQNLSQQHMFQRPTIILDDKNDIPIIESRFISRIVSYSKEEKLTYRRLTELYFRVVKDYKSARRRSNQTNIPSVKSTDEEVAITDALSTHNSNFVEHGDFNVKDGVATAPPRKTTSKSIRDNNPILS